MAHMEKYKAASAPAMLHHYDRDREATLERDNVDRDRTRLNYTVGEQRGMDYVRSRIAEVERSQGRAVRSDAVVMADWVITRPPDVRPEDEREFFQTAYDELCDRYGADNVLGGRVHMDETTPHMHCPVVPVVERDDGRLSLSAKQMFDRQDLRTFHRDLADREERALGYRPQVLLDPDRTLERALSRTESQREYRDAAERLERLRCGQREAGERNSDLRERAEDLREQVEDRAREVERDEGRERQAAEALARTQEEAPRVEEALRESRREESRLREAIERAREQIRRVESRIREVREQIRERLDERFREREAEREYERGAVGYDDRERDDDRDMDRW